MFELLSIKRFKKSSAGEDAMNDPAIVRPPIVLYYTMLYMIDVLVDQDLVPPGQSFFLYENQGISDTLDVSKATHNFTTIYSYLKDRTRQISQDLNFNTQFPTKYHVMTLEYIIRYLIISQHDGLLTSTYEIGPNIRQLTGIQDDLKGKYYVKI